MAVFSLKRTKWLFELDLLDEYKLLNNNNLNTSSYYNGVCHLRGKLFLLRENILKSKTKNVNLTELNNIINLVSNLAKAASKSKIDLNQLNTILSLIYKWGNSLVDDSLLKSTRICWIKTSF
jgi:hypothetical protein